MNGISDIRICGMDPTRPPRIRKEPYIDLNFLLNHKAPPDWCELFNDLGTTDRLPAKIAPELGLHVETWVRKPEDIAPILAGLKKRVQNCTQTYIARVEAAAASAADGQGQITSAQGEQGRLNAIIDALDFSD